MRFITLIRNLMPVLILNRGHLGTIDVHEQSLRNLVINSIHHDSRKVQPGSLFVCLSGYQTDGHLFAEEAVKRGAVAILAERELNMPVPVAVVPDSRRALAYVAAQFYQYPTERLRLIGITGTNGKTTVTYLIDKIMEDHGYKTGRIGTINIKIGQRTKEVINTTPESLQLQQAFAEMVDEECSHAVMEVSSHALDMGRVRGLNFDVAVFTNLTQDHLDYHGHMQAYQQAKGLLFSQLGSAVREGQIKYAVLNADDPVSGEYTKLTSAQVLTYGVETESADLRATDISLTPEGMRFTLQYLTTRELVRVPLVGMFNVYNVLAAIAVGLIEGIPLTEIRHSLEHMPGIPGRMETVPTGQDFSVIVDYAHTPDSLAHILQSLRQFVTGRVLCVIGCGGDRDRQKRPLMARIAAHHADIAVFTSDNPRSEDPEEIITEMEAGVISDEWLQTKYRRIVDRKEAINWGVKQARAGDVLVIAGKGHETYQEINGKRYYFDDREVVKEALRSLKRGD